MKKRSRCDHQLLLWNNLINSFIYNSRKRKTKLGSGMPLSMPRFGNVFRKTLKPQNHTKKILIFPLVIFTLDFLSRLQR